MNIHEEFLRFLDFAGDELADILPHWEKACKRLGLGEEELEFAINEWIPEYWDLSLHGVRKCIGAYIRELIELCRLPEYKADGAKILYYNLPTHPACMYANRLAGSEGLHVFYPEYIISTVFSAFFHKRISKKTDSMVSPLCQQCEMNQAKTKKYFQHLLPKPDVLWNWGLYCNESNKIEELNQTLEDRGYEYVFTVIPPDPSCKVHEAEDEGRYSYLARQLEESQRQIEQYTGFEVSEAHLIEATREYTEYMMKVEELTELVSLSDPQPISGNELAIFQAPAQIAFDTGFKHLRAAIEEMLQEVGSRVSAGSGPLPKGAPRLACHFVPFSVPWMNKAFMDYGVNLSVSTFFARPSRLAEVFEPEKIYSSIARQWLLNPSAVNMQNEADLVCEILERYPQDGVLYGFFNFGCWIGSLKKTLIKILESRTGTPHFYFESEFWNDERYSQDDRMARIKSIAYKLKINQIISGWDNGKKEDT